MLMRSIIFIVVHLLCLNLFEFVQSSSETEIVLERSEDLQLCKGFNPFLVQNDGDVSDVAVVTDGSMINLEKVLLKTHPGILAFRTTRIKTAVESVSPSMLFMQVFNQRSSIKMDIFIILEEQQAYNLLVEATSTGFLKDHLHYHLFLNSPKPDAFFKKLSKRLSRFCNLKTYLVKTEKKCIRVDYKFTHVPIERQMCRVREMTKSNMEAYRKAVTHFPYVKFKKIVKKYITYLGDKIQYLLYQNDSKIMPEQLCFSKIPKFVNDLLYERSGYTKKILLKKVEDAPKIGIFYDIFSRIDGILNVPLQLQWVLNIELTFMPYTYMSFRICSQEPIPHSPLLNFLKIFDLQIWKYLLIVNLALFVSITAMSVVSRHIKGRLHKSSQQFRFNILDLYGCVLIQGRYFRHILHNTYAVISISIWLLMTFILQMAFTGEIRTVLSLPHKEKPINTLGDMLYKMEHEGYWWSSRPIWPLFLAAKHSDIPRYRKLKELSNINDDIDEIPLKGFNRTNETYVSVAHNMELSDFLDRTMQDKTFIAVLSEQALENLADYVFYHKSKESFGPLYLCTTNSRGSHYTKDINKILYSLVETGISIFEERICLREKKFQRQKRIASKLKDLIELYNFSPDNIDKHRIVYPIYWLLAGWLLSIAAFFSELVLYCFKKRSNSPKRQKVILITPEIKTDIGNTPVDNSNNVIGTNAVDNNNVVRPNAEDNFVGTIPAVNNNNDVRSHAANNSVIRTIPVDISIVTRNTPRSRASYQDVLVFRRSFSSRKRRNEC